MKLLCWEGYESRTVLGEFSRRNDIACDAQTLLSDADSAHSLVGSHAVACDVLNINNPWVRDYLCHEGVVKSLDPERFGYTLENLLPQFDRLSHWAMNDDEAQVAVCQRFGAFNLVVNTDRIDVATAEDQGFDLANQPGRRFGILNYDDFNLFHICLGAGLNPFVELDGPALDLFSKTASLWYSNARLVSDDHVVLNKALAAGEIDFYVSGGAYTVSAARMAGHHRLRAVTPARGAIDGLGGIVFAEVTAAVGTGDASAHALDFLEFIVTPDIAYEIAMTPNTLNPVAQMADPKLFSRFSKQYLDAIQWDSLSADVERCAMYQIPPNHAQLLARLKIARHSSAPD